tara:strand:- start:5875 stop:7038 length:1164 start_codon:yes stop_codon:yes gene_type:complete
LKNNIDKFDKLIDYIKKIYSSENNINLHSPVFIGNEKKYLKECIDSTFVSSIGKFVDKFENEIAKFTGVKRAVLCVNGTNALHISLKLTGVSSGDDVLTQSLTFIATSNAIRYCNANPVFIDVDRDTLGMSPKSLRDFLENCTYSNNGKLYNSISKNKISACLPMHTFGRSARISEIKEICDEYNLKLVEDAAEALGSYYLDKHLGTFGELGVISFNGNKIITSGGGGVIITDNDDLANKAKHLTTQAKLPHRWEYNHDNIGYNYRMPNINAALGLAQLENIHLYINKKRKLAKLYENFFEKHKIKYINERKSEKTNYWLSFILASNLEERDFLLNKFNSNGIMARPAWSLVNNNLMYIKNQKLDLVNSEWLYERIINIPSSVIVDL